MMLAGANLAEAAQAFDEEFQEIAIVVQEEKL